MTINPYLVFNGNCEEALKFYETTLGAKILSLFRYEGSPMAASTPPDSLNKIMHARLQLADTTIMASDAPAGHYAAPQGMQINITVNDPTEAERLFHLLSEGGKVSMPIAETFWALRFGMLVDRFGIPWMINCEKPM